MHKRKPAAVYLENGLYLQGYSVGISGTRVAPLACNTQIVGHQEVITDPAYKGLILSFSMAQIGNVGARKAANESPEIQVEGLLLKDLSPIASNWQSEEDFQDFLCEHNLVAVAGLDTRALALALTRDGNMRAIISTEELDRETLKKNLFATTPNPRGLKTLYPGISEPNVLSKGSDRVVTFDTGTSLSTMRIFEENNIELVQMPIHTSAEEVLSLNPKGLFLGSAPALAEVDEDLVEVVAQLLGKFPVFGIQYGHLVLSSALGAQISEQKTGSFNANTPIKNLKKDQLEVVSKAQLYGVEEPLSEGVTVTHRNMHDNRIEGIEHLEKGAFSVSFFPKSSEFVKGSHELFNTFFNAVRHEDKGTE